MRKIRNIYKLGKEVIKLAKMQGNDYALGAEVRSLINELKL